MRLLAALQIDDQELVAPSGLPPHITGGLDTSGKGLIQTGFNILTIFAIFVTVVFLMYAGIQFITAGGDPGKLAAARRKLMFAIIGLVVVLGSFFIVNLVIQLLGGDSTNFFAPGTIINSE